MRKLHLWIFAIFSLSRVLAQSTAFTYQGSLIESGVPASGLYDLRFTLHDALASGSQVGPLVCVNNVPVSEGVFSVAIDFGPQFAASASRYLEVHVRQDSGLTCASSSGFTALSPRQAITATPTALRSDSTFAVHSPDGVPALVAIPNGSGVSLVGIGTPSPEALLHVSGGDLQIGKPDEDWIFHTRAHANGDFLHITDSDAGVYQFQRGLIVHQNGNIGVGTTAPASKLDVAGNLSVSGTISMAPQTRWKSVHGSAFMPQYLDHPSFGTVGGMQVIDSFGTGNSGTIGYASGSNTTYFFAPLDLPHGARVVDICIKGRDTMPGRDIVISLGRVSLSSGQVTEVATTFSSGSVGVIGSWCHGNVNELIDNNANVYFLRARMATGESGESGTHWLLAATVQYTVTSPLP